MTSHLWLVVTSVAAMLSPDVAVADEARQRHLAEIAYSACFDKLEPHLQKDPRALQACMRACVESGMMYNDEDQATSERRCSSAAKR